MPYEIKPLSCDPKKLKGLTEKLIVSHHENNYAGAVKRLNAIVAQFATLDVATAPVFVINGLKREELIATNSMILHELYFDGLGDGGEPDRALRDALTGQDWVLSNSDLRGWARRLWRVQEPYQYTGSSGGAGQP